jgi:hypothetical protein
MQLQLVAMLQLTLSRSSENTTDLQCIERLIPASSSLSQHKILTLIQLYILLLSRSNVVGQLLSGCGRGIGNGSRKSAVHAKSMVMINVLVGSNQLQMDEGNELETEKIALFHHQVVLIAQ